MKKIIGIFAALLVSGFLFAETATVKSVKGKVTCEIGSNKSQNVKVGQNIDLNTVVSTGVNSTLVVTLNGKDVTIKPMKKGTLESLTSDNAVGKGLKANPGKNASVAAAREMTGKGAETTSARGYGKGEEAQEIDE